MKGKSYNLNDNEMTVANSSNNNLKDNPGNILPLSVYQEWFDAIVVDNIQKAKSILLSTSENEQFKLVNSNFDYDKSKQFGIYNRSLKRVTIPFHLAVSFDSKKVAKLLLDNKADRLGISEDKDNVFHSCIVTSFNRPELEETICETIDWLVEILTEEDIQKLLFQENADGFYPLEFASQQGCLLILKKLLNLKGHVSLEENCGLQFYRQHDVTDYEIGNRYDKSPIGMLAYLDKNVLERPEYINVLLDPLISGWIDAKIKSNIVPIVIWLLIRTSGIFSFVLYDSGTEWLFIVYGNRSSEYICPALAHIRIGQKKYILMAFSALYCFLSLAKLIYFLIKRKIKKSFKKSQNINGEKNLLASFRFYSTVHNLLLVLLFFLNLFFAIIDLTNMPYNRSSYVYLVTDVGRAMIPVLILWSYAFFLQMVPKIGSSIISMQGMISDVSQFLLIFIVILLPFVHVFESYMLANSLTGCVPEFSSPFITAYTLFKVMLNIYDVSQLQVHNMGILYLIHILYVFMVGIMLLNFLIALMSTSAANIAQHKAVHLKINQLAVVVTLEERIFSKTKWMYKRLRKFGFLCEGDRIYLQSVSSRLGQIKQKQN